MVLDRWKKEIFSQRAFLEPYEHGIREFPFYVDIEATNQCNFRCLMCSRNIMKRDIGFMDLRTHRRIIDEVKEYGKIGVGVRYVRQGEPTLHPGLFDMIRYASSNTVLTYVSTHGGTLNQYASRIFDSGLDYLRVSLQGVDERTYNEMRDRSGRNLYEMVTQNIISFMEERSSRSLDRPYVCVGTTVTTEAEADKDRFKRYWDNIVDESQISTTTFSRVEGRVPEVDDFVEQIGYNEGRIRYYQPCTEVMTKISINWNGDITACGSDVNGHLIVKDEDGNNYNVQKRTLKEAWSSSYLNELRQIVGKQLRHEELYPCNVCFRENITDKFKVEKS